MGLIKKIISFVIIIDIIILIFIFLFFRGNKLEKMIEGCEYDYEYYDRKLTINDFKEFGYDSTYGEVCEKIGGENGNVGSGNFYPYYELNDGTYVIIRFYPSLNHIRSIDIADKNAILYSLLPFKMPHKEDEEKEKELFYAKNYEINVILDLLQIRKWKEPILLKEPDDPLGEYSIEELKKYIENDMSIKIDYEFEDYESLNGEPLFQRVEIYQNDVKVGEGLITWNSNIIIEKELTFVEDSCSLMEQLSGKVNEEN